MFEHAATWTALLGAFAYGSGDFLGGCASRRLETFSAVAIAQAASVVFMLQGFGLGHAQLPVGEQGLASFAAGLAYAMGVILVYDGLAHGRVAIVASVCGLLSILVPLAGDIVLGRSLTWSDMVGIAFCAAAALLIVGASKASGRCGSLGWSVRAGATSGIGFGVADLCLGMMPPEQAAGGLFITRSVAATIAVVLALGFAGRLSSTSAAMGSLIEPPGRAGASEAAVTNAIPARWTLASPGLMTSIALATAAGLLDTLGHAGYVYAATRGSMGVAAALVAIFPGVTVLLAAILLRERLTRAQLVGFAFGAAGIMFISG